VSKKQRDCVECGSPVGIIGREHCCRCARRLRKAAAKGRCPGCGRDRVLQPSTGRCVLCSRRCVVCDGPVRDRQATMCGPCRRRAEREAAKSPCPRCGRPGFIRDESGWCGSCSHPGPAKAPPRVCRGCGQLRRHAARGLCSRCWQRDPDRAHIRGDHLIGELPDPPQWLPEFFELVAAGHVPSRAACLVSALGRLLRDEHSNHPQAVLERSRRPGRSMGTLARALEDFFVQRGLALPTDQSERLAAGRRQRRVGAVPEPLRPAVQQFAEHMLTSRRRARTAGTRPRTDHTIEQTLAAVRDLARYLVTERGKLDWSVVDRRDVESFVAAVGSGRISLLRNFFRFARHRRIVLIDPTRGLTRNSSRSFIGKTLSMDRQRVLFHRWTTDPTIHPHEALLGVLALLHAASNVEVRMLQVRDIDMTGHSIRMGRRPHPVPLDPASWAAVQRALTHRQDLRTGNPHLVVTRGTKAGQQPASSAYVTHLLDPAGICPRTVRCTRLAALINSTDPKLVAAALGMNTQGAMFYLADHVDDGRLPPEAMNP
jgi:site-specific recombinase XerC